MEQNQSTPKTFMQRFLEIEQIVINHDKHITDANHAFSITGKLLETIMGQVKEINEQLHAVYVLSEDKKEITRETVSAKIQELRVNSMKKVITDEVEAGNLTVADSVSENSVVAFSTEDLIYAHKPTDAFPESVKSELLNKKVGDSVQGMTILGVYDLKQTQQPETFNA